MNLIKMFNNMHPGFFDDSGIKGMPKDWTFSELIMDLRNDSPREVVPPCPENITFGEYNPVFHGSLDNGSAPFYTVVAFCILSDWGMQDNLKVGGPGCVGTIPAYREKGIGLELVRRATDLLKKDKYDISWIHYTHLENWYKKLGYKTVLKWNSDGIVMEKQYEE